MLCLPQRKMRGTGTGKEAAPCGTSSLSLSAPAGLSALSLSSLSLIPISVPLCPSLSLSVSLPLRMLFVSILLSQCSMSIPICLSISVFLCVFISASLFHSLPLSPTSLSPLFFLSVFFSPSFLPPLLFFLNYLETGHIDIGIQTCHPDRLMELSFAREHRDPTWRPPSLQVVTAGPDP